MHPYRDPPPVPASSPDDTGDERVIAAVVLVVGVVPVVVTLLAHARFGAEPTVGLALALLGVIGLWRSRPRRPR